MAGVKYTSLSDGPILLVNNQSANLITIPVNEVPLIGNGAEKGALANYNFTFYADVFTNAQIYLMRYDGNFSDVAFANKNLFIQANTNDLGQYLNPSYDADALVTTQVGVAGDVTIKNLGNSRYSFKVVTGTGGVVTNLYYTYKLLGVGSPLAI